MESQEKPRTYFVPSMGVYLSEEQAKAYRDALGIESELCDPIDDDALARQFGGMSCSVKGAD